MSAGKMWLRSLICTPAIIANYIGAQCFQMAQATYQASDPVQDLGILDFAIRIPAAWHRHQ